MSKSLAKRNTIELIDDKTLKNIKNYLINGGLISRIQENINIDKKILDYCIHHDEASLYRKLRNWELQGFLKNAERVSSQILSHSEVLPDGSIDSSLLNIKQREAAFLREKLIIARDTYDTKPVQNNNIILPVPILQGLLDKNTDNVVKKDEIIE